MPEEGIKVHKFAAVLPKQLLTEARRHCDPVVPADQRAVMRCLGDDLAALVHDVSHSRIALSALDFRHSAFNSPPSCVFQIPAKRGRSRVVPSGFARCKARYAPIAEGHNQ
jgi:hypothetical protein